MSQAHPLLKTSAIHYSEQQTTVGINAITHGALKSMANCVKIKTTKSVQNSSLHFSYSAFSFFFQWVGWLGYRATKPSWPKCQRTLTFSWSFEALCSKVTCFSPSSLCHSMFSELLLSVNMPCEVNTYAPGPLRLCFKEFCGLQCHTRAGLGTAAFSVVSSDIRLNTNTFENCLVCAASFFFFFFSSVENGRFCLSVKHLVTNVRRLCIRK